MREQVHHSSRHRRPLLRPFTPHPLAGAACQMRSTDRALSNIEAHPDGFNALRRMYSSVQQPLYESLSAGAPSTSPENSPRPTPGTQQGAPGLMNTAALPNPWAPRPQPGFQPNPFFNLMGGGARGGGWGGGGARDEDEERRRRHGQ
eukprot:scaffold59438_cov26-Tisochrysis_lutea.AAC.2